MLKWSDRPRAAVDALIVIESKLVLVKRGHEPYLGLHALPGGFVEVGERTEDAVRREVLEETGLQTKVASLFGVYSSPDRDPRGHTISIVYELEKIGGDLKSGSDAADVQLIPLKDVPELAFDHGEIVADFKKKMRVT